MTPQQRQNISLVYNPFTIQKLQMTYPYVNWLEYFNYVFQGIWNIDENEEVIVVDRNYLYRLSDLLESTPNRTIANYFGWRLVLFSSDFLNDDLHNRKRRFYGQTQLTSNDRVNECLKKTMKQ